MEIRGERNELVLVTVEESDIKNGTFTIPGKVKAIGDEAFNFCDNLANITIPEGITSIGISAFSDCTSLTRITIPEGVKLIGDSAFSYCTSLTSITISKGVTSIGIHAFFACRKLTSITIPEGVTAIGYKAFARCNNLTSINIPEGVTSIGELAFDNCSPHLIITINTDDEAEVERIKQLLPPDLQKRVVSKRMSQEILKIQHDVIDGFLNKNSWLSPLRNLKIFCDDIKGTIASMFEDISTPLIKECILNVSIPQRPEELSDYKQTLKNNLLAYYLKNIYLAKVKEAIPPKYLEGPEEPKNEKNKGTLATYHLIVRLVEHLEKNKPLGEFKFNPDEKELIIERGTLCRQLQFSGYLSFFASNSQNRDCPQEEAKENKSPGAK